MDVRVRLEGGDVTSGLGVVTVVEPVGLLRQEHVAQFGLRAAILSGLPEAEERRNGDGDENCNDHHHDHQLDEREALVPADVPHHLTILLRMSLAGTSVVPQVCIGPVPGYLRI